MTLSTHRCRLSGTSVSENRGCMKSFQHTNVLLYLRGIVIAVFPTHVDCRAMVIPIIWQFTCRRREAADQYLNFCPDWLWGVTVHSSTPNCFEGRSNPSTKSPILLCFLATNQWSIIEMAIFYIPSYASSLIYTWVSLKQKMHWNRSVFFLVYLIITPTEYAHYALTVSLCSKTINDRVADTIHRFSNIPQPPRAERHLHRASDMNWCQNKV